MNRVAFRVLFAVLLITLAAQVLVFRQANGELSPWMHQFLILIGLIVPLSMVTLFLQRGRLVLIAVVALLVSIASVPFGDDLGIRLSVLFLLGIVSSSSGSVIVVSAVMGFHVIWAVGMRGVETPWMEAEGQTSLATIIALAAWSVFVTALVGREVENAKSTHKATKRIAHLESTVQTLSKANVGYSTFARIARHQALLEERNRITREIHDDVGHTLTNVIMLSESAISAVESDKVPKGETLQAIRQQAKTGLYETRRALRLMREAEHGLPRGIDALRELVRIYEKATGVETTIEILARRERIDDPSVFLTVYRFVQESLTNAFRHGKASEVNVRLLEDEDWLCLTVRDNGVGAAQADEGIGLQGMRERVQFLGGEIRYHQNSGFVVTAVIPLRALEESEEG
jgi:signal transduction histidine kinase